MGKSKSNVPFKELPFTDMCSPLTHLVPVETEMIVKSSIAASLKDGQKYKYTDSYTKLLFNNRNQNIF